MTCPACHGELAPWRVVPASDPALPGSFALERCRVCGSAVTLGPDPGAEAYAVGAYGGEPRLARLAAPILAAFDRRRLRLLARALDRPDTDLRGVRLLDAGAGRGRFVAGALAAGAQASGFEPAARGVQ
ncbi:MAG TPA: hypothetical protein VHX88_15015, partial [Solirubrobacteraceae bacterium]|nr:hypothetical protein [Solirubrobacteraceae bacterium]